MDNLPELKGIGADGNEYQLLDEQSVEQVVGSVQNELRNDRGPNFYNLPFLF
jgi:hypothetical protein